MQPALTYEVQKAVTEERLRKAALAHEHHLAEPRLRTGGRVPRHWWLRAAAGALTVIRAVRRLKHGFGDEVGS